MKYFWIGESITESPSNKNFSLHTHDGYEIVMLLNGDVTFIVEGKNYLLEKGDVLLVRKHQLHRAFHNTPTMYRRIVINIHPDFFKEYHCEEYEEQFISNALELDNKMNFDIVKNSGIYDSLMRLKEYSNNFFDMNSPVCIAATIEFLYLLNKQKSFSKADISNEQMLKVINYINTNFASDITLEQLSELFYISKYHLCRMFKAQTGLTFHKYLNQKRFSRFRELVSNGENISSASSMSGFGSYSSFYRAYLKEYGVPPKMMI